MLLECWPPKIQRQGPGSIMITSAVSKARGKTTSEQSQKFWERKNWNCGNDLSVKDRPSHNFRRP